MNTKTTYGLFSIALALAGCGPEDRAELIDRSASALTGSSKWAVILCKVNDNADEPRDVAYFENFISEKGAGMGGMNDFIHDMSYGTVDFAGSVVKGWFTIPMKGVELGALNRHQRVQACIDASGTAFADPSQFYGVIAMTNIQQDTGASATGPDVFTWSGHSYTLGGVVLDRVAWNVTIGAQEILHAYGLQHSWRKGTPDVMYGDDWDVMSGINSIRTYHGYNGGTFGNAGCTNWWDCSSGTVLDAHGREMMGWIPGSRIYTWGQSGGTGLHSECVTLAAISRFTAAGSLIAKAPVSSDGRYYMFELRRREAWDRAIPRDAVLVHEVRNDGLSYLVGSDVGAGESFSNSGDNIAMDVVSIDPASNTAVINIRFDHLVTSGGGGGGTTPRCLPGHSCGPILIQ